jgi:tRNA threonylcarbamoyladenosine biosynthesis protein TsaB
VSIRQLLSFTPMMILALDTTTRAGSCALAHDGVVVHELASDPGTSHAEHLPGDLIALLDAARIGLDVIDVFAVATGPGSFTGLRVGIATMQGLAFAMGKPLIGMSALDSLAQIVRSDSRSRSAEDADPTPGVAVATWVNAWRGEVYTALYEDGREREPPTVEHPAAILERLDRYLSSADHDLSTGAPRATVEGPRRCVFIGDGAGTFDALIRERLGNRAIVTDPVSPLLAGAVALLAYEAAQSGANPGPDAIRPLYVTRTDAELRRDARTSR